MSHSGNSNQTPADYTIPVHKIVRFPWQPGDGILLAKELQFSLRAPDPPTPNTLDNWFLKDFETFSPGLQQILSFLTCEFSNGKKL